MLHAGIGETHLNSVLTTKDMPPLCHKTVKKMERKVGGTLEHCAKQSCRWSLEDESKLTSSVAATAQSCENKENDGDATQAFPPEKIERFECRLAEGYNVLR